MESVITECPMGVDVNESIAKMESVVDQWDTKKGIRTGIVAFEEILSKLPDALVGDFCPLKHTFVDGAYVREITMPKGLLLTTKIHKVCHPYFILKGEVSVLTEDGVKRIKAPYSGITPAGTKRLIYIHEETVWTTVHVTNERDLKKIEAEVIVGNFSDLGIEVYEIEPMKLSKFIESISEVAI